MILGLPVKLEPVNYFERVEAWAKDQTWTRSSIQALRELSQVINRELDFRGSTTEEHVEQDMLLALELVEQYKQQYRDLFKTSFPEN